MATGATSAEAASKGGGNAAGTAAVRQGQRRRGSGCGRNGAAGVEGGGTATTRLRRKEFKARCSLLTELYKNDHIRTIYNVFTASFILLFVNMAVNTFADPNLRQIDRDLISWHFQGIGTVLFTWGLMFAATLVLYHSFWFWAFLRTRLQSSKYLQQLLDIPAFGAYAFYQLALLCGPPVLFLRVSLAPVTTAVLVIEQLRMMMKSHAFVRSNLMRAVVCSERRRPDGSTGEEGGGEEWTSGHRTSTPDFKHFLYFQFAPTLVYSDSYPRTERIRWRVVAWHACEAVGVALVCFVVFEQFLLQHLRGFWHDLAPQSHQLPPHQSPSSGAPAARLAALFCRCLFPGLIFLLLGFYAFFHSWMNASAELLRFADRRFYEAWWTTTTFANYYRSWNLIVHEWMYEYLYRDMASKFSEAREVDGGERRSRGRQRFASKVLVFLVSAAFHEYVVAACMRFLYPVLFIMFGLVGVALMYVPVKKGALGNIFMWLALSVGVAALLCAYCIEYYARRDSSPCRPPLQDAILDLLIPRSWTCNGTLLQL